MCVGVPCAVSLGLTGPPRRGSTIYFLQDYVLDLVGWARVGAGPISTGTRASLLSVCNKYGHVAVGTSTGFALLDLKAVHAKVAEEQYIDPATKPTATSADCRGSAGFNGVYVTVPGVVWVAFDR